MHKKNLRTSLFVFSLFCAALPSFAHADESLDCVVGRKGGAQLPLSNKIVDGQSVVSDTTNSLGLRLDASLAPGSFIFVLQDDAKRQRVAFTGTPYSVNWDGARMSTANANLGCRKKSSEPAKEIISVPRQDVSYFVCLLDEATFENGNLAKSRRLLQTVSSALSFHLPLKVSAGTDQYSFSVSTDDLDPVNGLSLRLTDKTTGETATFAGPPKSIVSSFMFGLTEGDRDANAKFLRLGCVFTDNPKQFLEDLKK